MMDLFICMNVEWEVIKVEEKAFRLLPAGTKFKLDGEVLIKLHGYNATGCVTRTNHIIDDERMVTIVE